MKTNQRIEICVANELARFAKAETNIIEACENGRISEHDRDERIARREQEAINYIAHVRGEQRPTQRVNIPLDDPDADRRYS